MAYVIIHELGHIAKGMYGEDASKIIPDGYVTKKEMDKAEKINRKTMEDCESDLKTLVEQMPKTGK